MKSGQCGKCGHNEIIVGQPPVYGDGSHEIGQMSVTADPRWVFGGRNGYHPHGRLYCYVCRKCGYTEWYADRPGEIPIGQDYSTRLLDANG